MSTHEQQITNNPTSAVRNTGGRNGPQGLEEPMSDEVLREMCDKNYHQLLPLIAEKMQKEKEQKDKLNAVKARLIYGEESGIKIRSREESHYSESKTPTARTEPRRRHGDRLVLPKPRHHTSGFQKAIRRNTIRTTSQYSESEYESKGSRKSNQEDRDRTPIRPITHSHDMRGKKPLSHLGIPQLSLPRTRCPAKSKHYECKWDPRISVKLFSIAAKTEESESIAIEDTKNNVLGKTIFSKQIISQYRGETITSKQKSGRIPEDLHGKYKAGRNVLRIQSKHRRTESMSGQSRHSPQLAISEMHQGRTEAKWKISKLKQFFGSNSARKIAAFSSQHLEKMHKTEALFMTSKKAESLQADEGDLLHRKTFRDNPFQDWCRNCGIPSMHCFPEASTSEWDTAFLLAYGTEAVIPAEIGMPTLRKPRRWIRQKTTKALESLGPIEERRRSKQQYKKQKAKKKMEKIYNSRVRSTSFKPGPI
ncbi:hypothetical protein Tco_0646738 [Tanacetum coccineum]